MRRRHHRGAGAALTRRCCATWPAHAPNGQRCSALPPRCPRAAPALPPRCLPRMAFYSPLASRCSHPCCTTCATSVTRRIFAAPRYSPSTAAPRRSLIARRRAARAACSPPRRPPPRSSLNAPLARRQLAQCQPTRRTPPHRPRSASLTAPLAHFCLSRRAAPSGPTLHRAARAPLAAPSRRSPPRRSRAASLTAPLAACHRALRMSTA